MNKPEPPPNPQEAQLRRIAEFIHEKFPDDRYVGKGVDDAVIDALTKLLTENARLTRTVDMVVGGADTARVLPPTVAPPDTLGAIQRGVGQLEDHLKKWPNAHGEDREHWELVLNLGRFVVETMKPLNVLSSRGSEWSRQQASRITEGVGAMLSQLQPGQAPGDGEGGG